MAQIARRILPVDFFPFSFFFSQQRSSVPFLLYRSIKERRPALPPSNLRRASTDFPFTLPVVIYIRDTSPPLETSFPPAPHQRDQSSRSPPARPAFPAKSAPPPRTFPLTGIESDIQPCPLLAPTCDGPSFPGRHQPLPPPAQTGTTLSLSRRSLSRDKEVCGFVAPITPETPSASPFFPRQAQAICGHYAPKNYPTSRLPSLRKEPVEARLEGLSFPVPGGRPETRNE